jgi:serine/threonine protein kinase
MSDSDCPSLQELQALDEGRLSEAALDVIAEHAEFCAQCQAILQRLHKQGASTTRDVEQFTSEPECQRAIDLVSGIPRALDERDPAMVGRYVIQSRIGSGGMGSVFKAHDPTLERDCVVKLLRSSRSLDDTSVNQFWQELKTLGKLGHRGIVTAYDAGEYDGRLYLVMEYVSGFTLREIVLSGGPLPVEETIRVGRQLLDALESIHKIRLVHRDIKPANIMITSDESKQVKLLDFGLSIRPDDVERPRAAGTLAFMAPEQTYPENVIDWRADYYALGATLFYLLTGRPPIDVSRGDHPQEQSELIRTVAPEMSLIPDDVPESLSRVIRALLAKEPKDRPQSAAEIRSELDRADPKFDGSNEVRRPFVVATILASLLAVISLAVLAVWNLSRRVETPLRTPNVAAIIPEIARNQKHVKSHIGTARRMPGQRNFVWYLDTDLGTSDPKPDISIFFGESDGQLIAGRWSRGHGSLPGIVSRGSDDSWQWTIDRDGDCLPDGVAISFGWSKSDVPLVTDWNGDGIDEFTFARRGNGAWPDTADGLWHWIANLDDDILAEIDVPFMKAQVNDVPFVGVWRRDQRSPRPGIARPNSELGSYQWFFQNDDEHETSTSVTFGNLKDYPIVGDFDGDGLTDMAVVEEGQLELIWKFDYNRDGVVDRRHAYGLKGDQLLVGHWQFPQVAVKVERGAEIFPTSVIAFRSGAPDHAEMRFDVTNRGTLPLTVGQVEVVAGEFEVARNLARRDLLPGESDSFEIRHVSGSDDGLIAFENNDPDAGDFRFALTPPEHLSDGETGSNVVGNGGSGAPLAITCESPTADSRFGSSVAATDRYVVVGAPNDDSSGENAGAVYVFRPTGSGFSQWAKFAPKRAAAQDRFGISVDADVDLVVVAAAQGDGVGPGYVCVFQKGPTDVDQWREVSRLEMPSPSAGSKFGSSVAISSDVIVVGAAGHSFDVEGAAAQNAGSVFVFEHEPGGDPSAWSRVTHLTAPDPRRSVEFGATVDVHQFMIAVGTRMTQESAASGDAACVFSPQFGRSIRWGVGAGLSSPKSKLGSQFGHDVRIQRQTIAVVPKGIHSGEHLADVVSLFVEHPPITSQRNLPEFKLGKPDSVGNETADHAISLAFDDRRLLVGTRLLGPAESASGKVLMYACQPISPTVWALTQVIQCPGGASPDFAHALALNRDFAFVGDPSANVAGVKGGAVFALSIR